MEIELHFLNFESYLAKVSVIETVQYDLSDTTVYRNKNVLSACDSEGGFGKGMLLSLHLSIMLPALNTMYNLTTDNIVTHQAIANDNLVYRLSLIMCEISFGII